MSNPDIIQFIKTEQGKGFDKQKITQDLLSVGWQQSDIDASYAAMENSAQVAAPSAFASDAPAEATEKDYPITLLWVFKAPIIIVVISIIAFLFGIWFPYLILALIGYLIRNPLVRANFHYKITAQYFVVSQGIFSKSQRNLPYGVIQNVFAKQDVFDRIFGLATLRVENASFGGGAAGQGPRKSFRLTGVGTQQETLGASGNTINLPGLRKKDADALKEIILRKMKENPLHDNQSGL